MALPTLGQVRTVGVAWWRGGRPHKLDLLRAQLAALCTDPLTSVRVRVVDLPPLTLQVQFEQRDGSGNVVQTVTRSATKDDLDALVNVDFGDIRDDLASSMRERGEV